MPGRSAGNPGEDSSITGPIEDYLKAIYDIELQGGSASTNDIAARLSFAPGSVTGMMRRLSELGLLTYERYHGVRLTAAGRTAALRTLRRHRVIEAYLVHALGYDWDGVHDEAERLEHAASDALIDRMAAAIGEPAVDPHGAPIPTRDGAIDETQYCTLADLGPGHRVRVVRVTDDEPEVLRYFAELGIRPGASLAVLAREYDGPITIAIGDERLALGSGLASRVMVDLVSDVTAPAH
ncbi:MAG TPA: metal-dependent transcriptional regulator [Gemmatimonadaceae bacterium]|nr:metal-dependent transcriptional regulator [Gemmatimonadaceae bacterium]